MLSENVNVWHVFVFIYSDTAKWKIRLDENIDRAE